MKTFLLVGAAVVFAGVAATMALAADHKSTKHSAAPTRTTVVTPAAKTSFVHKTPSKAHPIVKKHHRPVHRTHHAK